MTNFQWWQTPNLLTTLVKEYGENVTKQYLREKFKDPKNKMAFAMICFSHHFVLRSPEFHYLLLEAFSLPNNVGIAAPRGFAKSTLSMVDDIWDIVNANRHYIVKLSDSYTQALEHCNTMQSELENNEILRWLYGDLKTDKWSEGEFITSTDVKVVAKGQSMKIRGLKYKQYRPDKIDIDDLENDEIVENPERRDKLKKWFKRGVIPALARGGKINMVGTVLHHDSLLANIINQTDEFAGWTIRKYKALNEVDGQLVSLWPEMYSVDDLLAMRDDPKHPRYIGSIAFSQEYQNEPMSEEDAVIKRAWIKYQDHPPALRYKVIAIDPAISKKDKADNTSIQCWGLGIDNNAYCLEAIKGKWSFTEQGRELRAMYQRQNTNEAKVNKVLIEEVAYQSALKEHPLLTPLPVVGITPEKDKRTRLIVVSKWFEAGMVYLKSSMEDVVEEVVNFGAMAHDDTVDSMTMAVNELKNENNKTEIAFA
jgi:predicted phage terminase large subunit-like protein